MVRPQGRPVRSGYTYIVAASNSTHPDWADIVCDGTADEATITTACAGGGHVKLLDGTYTVADKIDTVNNLILEGSGMGSTVIVAGALGWTGDSRGIIHGDGVTDVVVRDLMVDGTSASQSGDLECGIMFDDGSSRIRIADCRVHDAERFGINFRGNSSGGTDFEVRGCYVDGNNWNGIQFYNSNAGTYNTDCRAISNYVTGSSDVGINSYSPYTVIQGNIVYDITGATGAVNGGWSIGLEDNKAQYITVADNLCYGSKWGICTTNDVLGDFTITGNTVSGMSDDVNSIYGDRNVFSSNVVQNNTAFKIGLIVNTGSDDCVISNNVFSGAANSHGIKVIGANNLVTGNRILVPNKSLEVSGATSDYNVFTNNVLDGGATGITIGSGCEDTIVKNNDFVGVTTPVSDSGTNTIYNSFTVPFSEGNAPVATGFDIDGAADDAYVWFNIPPEVQGVLRLRVTARSIVAEADEMHIELTMNGGADNEAYNTHTSNETNLDSVSTNFGADDIIYWDSTHASVLALTGGDYVSVLVNYEAAVAPDCATDAHFMAVTVFYV